MEQLESGTTVSERDIRRLLFKFQQQQLDAALASVSADPNSCKQSNRRQAYIETLRSALSSAIENEGAAWERKVRKAEIRQARIYLEGLKEAEAKGLSPDLNRHQNYANRKLQQAGLRRLDGSTANSLRPRDRELREIEDDIERRSATRDDDWDEQ